MSQLSLRHALMFQASSKGWLETHSLNNPAAMRHDSFGPWGGGCGFYARG